MDNPAERGQAMRVGDPEYKRQIKLIQSIPSNKVDAIDLSGLTEIEMAEY